MGFSGLAEQPRDEGGDLITYGGDAPVVTVAATGAGKTSGPVVCNARSYPGQLICLDVKGEAYRLSADHRRRMGQDVHVLDLRDNGQAGCGALNPLDLARMQGDDLGAVARAVAAEMIERPDTAKDFFWIDWAETMLTAGIAYLMQCKPDECRLSKLFDLYTMEADVSYNLAVLLDTHKELNRATYGGWAGYLQLPDKETRPSVLGSTTAYLRLFESDLVRRLTDCTTIDLAGLIAGKPMSLYIIVPPHRIRAYASLLRLWLSGLMNLLTLREQPLATPTLMLVDEAAQLGRVGSFVTAMTLMRGYSLKLWTFWQAVSQIEIYGTQARTIIDNAGVVQVFGVRNHRAAAEIANLLGGIAPEALAAMGADEQVLLVEGDGLPRFARQIRYYEEEKPRPAPPEHSR